jgi:concanavalin A-like lectin/glucanase superfamily protein
MHVLRGPFRTRVGELVIAAAISAGAAILAGAAPATAQGAGLVAAYAFDEGSGSTVGDSSGNGNHGSVSGATWTSSSRYGRALVFDGSNDVVVVSDSSSLDLVDGMTLEAWVYPTRPLSGWKAILQKEVDAWFLDANTGGDRVGTGGTFDGLCCTVAEGPSALVPNQWTHVAGTWDGATLRLYLNGVEVASEAHAGPLEVNDLPLRIGGNTYGSEFFPGRIDEVRIYGRALGASEIQTDLGTPVGGAPVGAVPTRSP